MKIKLNLPWKKIFKISGNALVILVFIFALLMVLSKFGIGNLRILTVKSGSMTPTLYTGSIIFVAPQQNYKTGDIITFRGQGQKEYITHRITEVDNSSDQPAYRTKGDANDAPDSYKVPYNGIAGKVHFSIPLFGYILEFVKTAPGLILLIVIPATIIIYEEIKTIKNEWKKISKRRRNKKDELSGMDAKTMEQHMTKKGEIWRALKKHRKIFLFAVAIAGTLFFNQTAFALTKTSGHLTIDYPQTPLFNETNISPGYFISQPITITNNADEEKNVAMQFNGTTSTELNNVLNFYVKKNNEIIYGGPDDKKTLTEIIGAGEIPLTTLAAGASANFYITAELNNQIGNEYQNKATIFNLSVGFTESDITPPSVNTNTPSSNINLNLPNANTNNTNGLVLGENIVNTEPPLKGKILGVDVTLPVTGGELISYTLIAMVIILLSATSITILVKRARNN